MTFWRNWLFILLLLILASTNDDPVTETQSHSQPQLIKSERLVSNPVVFSSFKPFNRVMGSYSNPFFQKTYDSVSESSYYDFLYELSVNIGPRDWPSPENDRAVEWIESSMLQVSQGAAVVELWGEHDSVVGILEGYDPSLTDIIVIGGHMDSVTNVCPGADDNASGTALVLEALRAMSQYHFPRDIYFCAFNAEEDWLLGSEDVAAILEQAGVQVKMMFNADMLLWDPEGSGLREYIYCREGNFAERHAAELVKNFSRLYGDDVFLLAEGVVPAADQLSFHQHGFNAVFAIETNFNDQNYHKVTDTIFHPECNFTLATDVTASFATAAAKLAFEDISPTIDFDSDGLADMTELEIGTEPTDSDTDNDGLLDGEEVNQYQTDPLRQDSDNDNLLDGEEIQTHHTDPLNPDSDADGVDDGQEIIFWNTNPLAIDTDADGLSDYDEVTTYHTSPLKVDSDADGLPDGQEIRWGTDPGLRDSDGDLIPDGEEVERGWNPLDPANPGDTKTPKSSSSNADFLFPVLLLGIIVAARRRNK
ncbi:MAG: M28 family peptidase [Candidatus Hodarchaeales archaeon]|jgi:hypothetical protein